MIDNPMEMWDRTGRISWTRCDDCGRRKFVMYYRGGTTGKYQCWCLKCSFGKARGERD